MGKRKVCALLVFVVSVSAWSQNIRLEGVVLDSLGVAISTANIVATNQETNRMDNFAISDMEGKFSIGIKNNVPYTIKISYLGYKPVSLDRKSTTDLNEVIVMYEQAEQLDGVEVTYEMPVSIQGDTIVYNADSFNTGSERKLKDVLENLPGVEITSDGQIEVEGRKVTKVMVEGKDFFDGDSKIATENIPANAVDKVQVLKNFNEISQLSGVTNNDDNIAINIKLKEGKDRFWFGELGAGGGEKDRILLNPKVFYYSPKTSINFLGNRNNLGENPFTRQDYFRFTGGFRNQSNQSGSSVQIQTDDVGLSNLQNNNAASIENDFAATNFSHQPKEGLTLSGFAILSQNNTRIKSIRERTFTSTGAKEVTDNDFDQSNTSELYKFSTLYNANPDFQFEYDVFYRKADESEYSDLTSSATRVEEISSLREQTPKQLSQNLNAYFTLNEKHIFALELQHTLQEENPFFELLKERILFPNVLPLSNQPEGYLVQQNRFTKTNKLDGRLEYYYMLNDTSSLNFTVGTTQVKQDYTSSMGNTVDGTLTVFDQPNLINDVHFDFSDIYTAVRYRVKVGKFLINPGFTLHNYDIKTLQLNPTTSKETRILPDVWVRYQFRKSESLRFTYRAQLQYSDVSRLGAGYTFNNYNRLFLGNSELKPAYFHNFSLNYFNFNMFNFTNIFIRMNYRKQFDNFKTVNVVSGINRESSPFNSPKAEERISINARLQKRFNNLKTSFTLRANKNKSYNIVNGDLRQFDYFTQFVSATLATNFKAAPNIQVGYSYNNNRSKDEDRVRYYINERPFVGVDAAILNGFIFLADYSFYDYRLGSTSLNKYDDLSASLLYNKKDSKWEFGLQAKNVLGNSSINRDNFSGISQTTTLYMIQPRFIYLTIKYFI
jgi:hypothetical protein